MEGKHQGTRRRKQGMKNRWKARGMNEGMIYGRKEEMKGGKEGI